MKHITFMQNMHENKTYMTNALQLLSMMLLLFTAFMNRCSPQKEQTSDFNFCAEAGRKGLTPSRSQLTDTVRESQGLTLGLRNCF